MRNFTFTFIAFLFLITNVNAQEDLELGVFVGVTNYMGDLSPTHVTSLEYHLATGIFGRYNIDDAISVKAHFYKGEISGADTNSGADSDRRGRNLSFVSKVLEFGVQGEYDLLSLIMAEDRLGSIYVFGGISGFYFNPKASLNGEWYELQPIGTEGQGNINPDMKKYNRFQVAIPLGLGANIEVGDFSKIGFEFGVRKTFTDYLDDVSTQYPDIAQLNELDPLAAQLSFRNEDYFKGDGTKNPMGKVRGNPDHKDWYLFTGVQLSINITELISSRY